jgi:hypothetical protein
MTEKAIKILKKNSKGFFLMVEGLLIYSIFEEYSSSICMVSVMMFNTTFNNISVIWWRSVLLVEGTRVP